jgi:type II restriction/modification system DNA methylase subunit YeeA
MNVSEFVAKWRKVELTERSASQQHFLDLCEVLDHPKPAQDDPTGERFTFEKGSAKHGGSQGWADVWKKGFFGWEYKGKHKDLKAAYDQLLLYREALENPPLLVVCDMDRIEIHTNFTATVSKTYEIRLDDLDTPRNIEIMRNLFHEPGKLRPDATSEAITKEVAQRLAQIAQGLRQRGLDSMDVARFLDRIVFCLFAEDVALLPLKLFSRIVEKSPEPQRFSKLIGQLFDAMNEGGDFGIDTIRHFNGNLFTESPVLELTATEIGHVKAAARLDWSAVDPSIFGTLFQRGLDPDTRAQLGAQYTSREDIETLVEPVVMQPLRREWAETRSAVEKLLEAGTTKRGDRDARALLRKFHERLAELKVLDPACGSGNFLYVTLQKLKDLEKEVLVYAGDKALGNFIPLVGPWQFYGIEINPYAFELAQTTLWIGYLQWIQANGFGVPAEPILRRMDNFRNMDAILDLSDPDDPKEPEWPVADFIVGNPPFLGNKRMRTELGDEYTTALWKLYGDRLPATSDLSAYWFEKAREMIETGRVKQAGLLATTGLRQVGSRRVLERISETGGIFFAVSDRDWILDGASVRISIIGFGSEEPSEAILDGQTVSQINADLTAGCDLTQKRTLAANQSLCFMGTTKVGAFDIDHDTALQLLQAPNPHGRPNSDVLRPFRNGSDLVRLNSHRWVVDFGVNTLIQDAALYEAPFGYLLQNVRPVREKNNDKWRAQHWWLLGRTLPDFRNAMSPHRRYIGTPRVSKYRVFVWLDTVILPDSKVIAIALSDVLSLGVLQSRVHEIWTLATCGWHGIGNDATYNPRECFETFPFPVPSSQQEAAIATAAKELDELRSAWLNPPEWTREEILEFPGSTDGPWARYVSDADERGIGTVRYPRLIPKDETAAEQLAKRTLTNLYNERPTWLDLAHRKLNEAVFAAYGWEATLSDDEILTRLLALNQQRAAEEEG